MSFVPNFLGIDGGGTRTTAWLADEQGRVLGRGIAGPSNPLKVGFDASRRELVAAARRAIADGGFPSTTLTLRPAPLGPLVRRRPAAGNLRHSGAVFESVCVGLAGVDRPSVHRRVLAWLRRAIRARRLLLTSDAAIALFAAVGDAPGIIVISGTGSIAYGQDERGRVLRSGGWGTPYDDAGSGYDLGRKAITAALHDLDGRGPHTQLLGKICQALHLADITQIILKPLKPQQVAMLFPLVLQAAKRRDFVARKLCREAGCDLADLALALLKRLGWRYRVVPVVCAGGVFRASSLIRRSFRQQLRRGAPGARVLTFSHPPVEGALALARKIAQPSSPSFAGVSGQSVSLPALPTLPTGSLPAVGRAGGRHAAGRLTES